MCPVQQFNSLFKICLFYSLSPCPAPPCLALPLARATAVSRTNNFGWKKCIYTCVHIWSRLYRIVGLSLCEMLKTHVESFPSVNCFLFLLHTHTHTCTHPHSARYASRPFLLPTFVRSENCKAFRACASCVCVRGCEDACV